MSFSSESKYRLHCQRSNSYLALIIVFALLQALIFWREPKLWFLAPASLFVCWLTWRHWQSYTPRLGFSANFLQVEAYRGGWGSFCRIGLGFCVVQVADAERDKPWVIFADSLDDADYRRLCAHISLAERQPS